MLEAVYVSAWKDENGQWRFAIRTEEGSGHRGRMILGADEGMLEPEFRTIMAERYDDATPARIDKAIQGAKEEVTNG